MHARFLRPVLLGLVVGVLLPTFVVGTVHPAVVLGGMTVEASNQIVVPAYIWGEAPGRLLLAVLGLEAHPTAAHARGLVFWREFVLLYFANWLGWAVIFLVIQLSHRWIASLRAPRLGLSGESSVGIASDERPWARWKVALATGFVLGGLLPISVLGVIVLSKAGAVDALWRESTAGMQLVKALLLPGNALLLFGESRLQLGAQYASQAAFWRSYAAQLLANGCAWTTIVFLARFAWLRWLRDPMGDLHKH